MLGKAAKVWHTARAFLFSRGQRNLQRRETAGERIDGRLSLPHGIEKSGEFIQVHLIQLPVLRLRKDAGEPAVVIVNLDALRGEVPRNRSIRADDLNATADVALNEVQMH